MIIISLLFIVLIYFITFTNTLLGGDSGELVSAVITKSTAHPPGYPSYILLGILLKNLPFSFLTTAGKVALTSTFSTIISLYVLYLLIQELTYPKYFSKYIVLLTLLILSVNYLVWLYTIVPEVFPLNVVIILSIFYFSIRFYRTNYRKYLYLMVLFIGFGITHHHTFVLVLPAVFYLIYLKRDKISLKSREIVSLFVFFMIGLLPLIYLVYAGINKSEIAWDKTDTVIGFFNVLLRLKYGTFVATPLVFNTPQQRLTQLKNLYNFILDDFLILGLIFFLLGVFFFLRLSSSPLKKMLKAAFISLVFFGPLFIFYANFPLLNAFYLATIERFFLVFYFFFAIFIYLGIYFFIYHLFTPLINLILKNTFLKKFTSYTLLLLLLIYPVGLFKKNYDIIHALRNDRTAENLGIDVLQSTVDNSVLLLDSDNMLFTTQYIYFDIPKYRKNKNVIHANKLKDDNYQEIIKKHYPKLEFKKNTKYPDKITNFIANNKNSFHIYSENTIPIDGLDGYEWVTNGLIFKLVKSDQVKAQGNIDNIRKFWQTSLNKDLVKEYKQNKLKFKNLFLASLLPIYADAHRHTAYYLLYMNQLEEARKHIQEAIDLEYDEVNFDKYDLFSIYFQKKGECKKAESVIDQALTQYTSERYLRQLQTVAKECYKDESNKKRIANKIKKYLQKKATTLENF